MIDFAMLCIPFVLINMFAKLGLPLTINFLFLEF